MKNFQTVLILSVLKIFDSSESLVKRNTRSYVVHRLWQNKISNWQKRKVRVFKMWIFCKYFGWQRKGRAPQPQPTAFDSVLFLQHLHVGKTTFKKKKQQREHNFLHLLICLFLGSNLPFHTCGSPNVVSGSREGHLQIHYGKGDSPWVEGCLGVALGEERFGVGPTVENPHMGQTPTSWLLHRLSHSAVRSHSLVGWDEAGTCHGWQTDAGLDDECLQVLPSEGGAAPVGCVPGREGKPEKRLPGRPWAPSLPPRRPPESACLGRAGYGCSPWADAREGRGAGCREATISSQSQALTWLQLPRLLWQSGPWLVAVSRVELLSHFWKNPFSPVTAKKPLTSQAH